MRDLVVTQNITVDGVIDAAEGWFGPSGPEEPAELAEVQREQREGADALLVGRRTFEAFAEFWPKQVDDTTGVSAYLNGVDKYVVSATMDDPAWERSTVLRGPVLDEVRQLKERDGTAIVVTGSMRLVHTLVPSGLVDEYRLFVHPVALGRGMRLFGEANGPRWMTLVEARGFSNGVALLRYRKAD